MSHGRLSFAGFWRYSSAMGKGAVRWLNLGREGGSDEWEGGLAGGQQQQEEGER